MDIKKMAQAIEQANEAGLIPFITKFYEEGEDYSVESLEEYLQQNIHFGKASAAIDSVAQDLYYEKSNNATKSLVMDSGIAITIDIEEYLLVALYSKSEDDPGYFAKLEVVFDKEESIQTFVDAMYDMDTAIMALMESIGFDNLGYIQLRMEK
jgi:hypothetical protein